MSAILGTIVHNVWDNAPQYYVYCSTMLRTFFNIAFFWLILFVPIALYWYGCNFSLDTYKVNSLNSR